MGTAIGGYMGHGDLKGIFGIDEGGEDFSVFSMAEITPKGMRIVRSGGNAVKEESLDGVNWHPIASEPNQTMDQLKTMLAALDAGAISALGIPKAALTPYHSPTITTNSTAEAFLRPHRQDTSDPLFDHLSWEAATPEIAVPEDPEQDELAPRRIVEL
jgi:hypothetical protein